jgi:Tfp pilus assembly protein PilO
MNSRRIVLVLLLVLLGLAVISTVSFVFLPRERAAANLLAELDTRENFIRETQHLDAMIFTMENELKAARTYVDARDGTIPTDAELVSVFGKIASEAKDSGVVTQSFQPQKPDNDQSPIKRSTATLVIEGCFQEIFDFLGRLERLPVALWLDELQLQKADEGTNRLSCAMTLVIFADNRGNSD